MLEIASPYMLRNDGKLIKCDVMHPYIKYIVQNSDKDEIENLFNKRLDQLIWFYNNCKSDETKKYISIFAYSVLSQPYYKIHCNIENKIPNSNPDDLTKDIADIESLFLVLNDQLNQEFLRVRTSSKLFGGKSHAIYFRISSTDFNWFNLIWNLCYENKDWISDVTISLNLQSRESNVILNHKGIKIEKLPIKDFINLSGNPIFENLNNTDNVRKQLKEGKSLFEIFTTHPSNIHNCFNMLIEKYMKENFKATRLNNYLKDLIKHNINEIQSGDFLHIYQTAFDLTSSYDCYQVSKFTNAMYDAGIDPLQYTNGIIPECFLFEDIFFPYDFVKIPDNCRGIWEQAFSGCIFDGNFPVIIPATCLEIRKYAFASSKIRKIELKCINKCNIWDRAFDDATIDEMWLNEVPTNANFLKHVDIVKALYLPITTMEEFNDLIPNILYKAIDKIDNVISSITGELFK